MRGLAHPPKSDSPLTERRWGQPRVEIPLSDAMGDELVPPLMRRSVVDEDVHAVVFFELERRRIPHESAVAPASDARDEHPLSHFHGHIVPGVPSRLRNRPGWG